MAKDREIVCKYYASLGVCEKGREASHRGYCQRCDKYIPRAYVKTVNRVCSANKNY